jgi:hypothetical protein
VFHGTLHHEILVELQVGDIDSTSNDNFRLKSISSKLTVVCPVKRDWTLAPLWTLTPAVAKAFICLSHGSVERLAVAQVQVGGGIDPTSASNNNFRLNPTSKMTVVCPVKRDWTRAPLWALTPVVTKAFIYLPHRPVDQATVAQAQVGGGIDPTSTSNDNGSNPSSKLTVVCPVKRD